MRTNIDIDDRLMRQAMRTAANAPRKLPWKRLFACWSKPTPNSPLPGSRGKCSGRATVTSPAWGGFEPRRDYGRHRHDGVDRLSPRR